MARCQGAGCQVARVARKERGWRGGRGGFTLLELLVAVGALAVVAVGVAAIFDATGRTVRAGKRVSAFTQYAAAIERQMRADIQSMTRDGFLVIRNEYADGNGNGRFDDPQDAVPRYEGDPAARVRRTDEVMFFAKGKFYSARELMHADFAAAGEAARIYYGHGKRMIRPDPVPAGSPYLRPNVDDTFETDGNGNGRLGYQGSVTVDNPNRYAADWMLLRQVTVLRQPRIGPGPGPSTPGFVLPPGVNVMQLVDSDTQIALQPAASGVFRSLNAIFPVSRPATNIRAVQADRVAFANGLVDIASTDLGEIAAVVMTASRFPGQANQNFFDPAANSGPDLTNQGVDGVWQPVSLDATVVQRMRAWMEDALPAYSTPTASTGNAQRKTRLRYEPAPPDYVGVQVDPGLGAAERAYRRADQAMLSSSNFLPRCTEFIVEWSFGSTFPSDPASPGYVAGREGETVWHGMERIVNGVRVCEPYGSPFQPWSIPISTRYRRIDGMIGTHQVPVEGALIHDAAYNATQPYEPLGSFFGYADPTFNPDANGDGELQSGTDSAEPTIPWPWPKLIRVTLSLADPRDASVEQTFQFVFDVPAGRAGR
jgi:prepilin-type N-terminal cleavage/methylation domain-containing protein